MKNMYNQILVPTVIEKSQDGERAYDIYSRLLKDRIIMIGGAIDDNLANIVIAQLLFLDSQDDKSDIHLYINSPGGSVTAGMAMYDTMQFVKSDVTTTCVGMAASMGAFLLAGGAKGKRAALPNSKILIHQVLAGFEGQATDVKIQAEEILRTKEQVNKILAKNTGQTLAKIDQDTDRDFYMRPLEAKKYGLIDKVINTKA